MALEPRSEKDKSKSILLLALLLAGAAFFYFIGIQNSGPKSKPRDSSSHISAYSAQANDMVNKHLALTSKSLELQEKKRKFENQFSMPQLGDSIIDDPSRDKDMGVDHSADANEDNAYQDLNRYPREIRATDPDRIIRNQIAEQDLAVGYENAYREEYARQFIENARKNGYEVKLNSDYVVISVRKIRTPSNYNLGPQAR